MADEINATKTAAKYESHQEGQFVSLAVDAINLGEKVSTFPGAPTKLAPRASIVFRTGEVNSHGEPIDIAQEFTVSMHEKANLRKFLESWRGKSYTEEQAEEGVPIHKLVGHPALISVEHKTSAQGRTYAVISSISPVPKGLPVPKFPAYTRAEYWEERKAQYKQDADAYRKTVGAPKANAAHGDDDSDSSLPF